MKGEQVLHLTHGSIAEAVEEYLSRHFLAPVVVRNVDLAKGAYHDLSAEVKFELVEAASAPATEKGG